MRRIPGDGIHPVRPLSDVARDSYMTLTDPEEAAGIIEFCDICDYEATVQAAEERAERYADILRRARLWVAEDQDTLCFVHESGKMSVIILESADDFTDFGHVRRFVAEVDAALAQDAERIRRDGVA